ncbi:MAG: DUF4124 domain-containing protein [Gammaproteobacteria bacterium]|nr:DUF4124 domain-containing protein [Gammaproteobacteria bacterium]
MIVKKIFKLTIVFMVAGSMALASLSYAAAVYTWTDDEGKIHFTDKPVDLAVDRLGVQVNRTDTDAIVEAREEKNMSEEELSEKESEKERQARISERFEKEREEVRAANCKIAQDNYDKLNAPRRLYEKHDDGERRYLENEEIDERRAHAESQVREWCDE